MSSMRSHHIFQMTPRIRVLLRAQGHLSTVDTNPGTSIQCDARSCQGSRRSGTHRQGLPTRAASASIPPSGR